MPARSTNRRGALAVLTTTAVFTLGLGPHAQAAPADAQDSYQISTRTGASMLTGNIDAGLNCYNGCGATLNSPFQIDVYGHTYSQMYVSSEGTVQFGGSNSNASNPYAACLPANQFEEGAAFLPYWNDADTTESGDGVFYQTFGSAPNRQFVIEWREEAADETSSDHEDFSEAFSESSGVVTTTYSTDGGSYVTIGAQNQGASTTSQYACNGSDYGGISAGLQLTYTPTTTSNTTPGAPTQLSAQQNANTATSVDISWQPPLNDGGSAVTGYIVSRNGKSSSGSGPYTSPTLSADRRSYTFAKLIPGDTYELSVEPVNGNGHGDASTIMHQVPKGSGATLPGVPDIGRARAGRAGGPINASVAWTPGSTGGSAITSYTVYAFRVVNNKNVETEVSRKLGAGVRSYDFPLDHSGQWRFKIAAANSVGNGPLSGYSNTVVGR